MPVESQFHVKLHEMFDDVMQEGGAAVYKLTF